jgi:hypothetical protein
MKTVSFSDLNSFLPRHCGPDLRQETCEFKALYFWTNCRKLNLLSNDTNLAIFGPLRLEIRAINRDSIWSAGNSGPIQSMFDFTTGFCLLSNLVSENTLISHEVNSSKRDPKSNYLVQHIQNISKSSMNSGKYTC